MCIASVGGRFLCGRFVLVSDFDCVDLTIRRFAEERLTCDCPELCDDRQFDLYVSSSDWPSDDLADVIMTAYFGRSDVLNAALVNRSTLRANLLKVDVFYDEMKYEKVEEIEAYPVSSEAPI